MNSGTAPKPCPTVYDPLPDGHVKLAMLNPDAALTLTVEFTEPLVLDDVLPPAFQFQATIFPLLLSVCVPTVYPSEFNTTVADVSASVTLGFNL